MSDATEMYPEPPPVPDAVVGMVVAFFPHANGAHPGWTGLPYRAVVVAVPDENGRVHLSVEDGEDDGLGEILVPWGHPNVWARRNDAAFSIPWEERFATETYDH